MKPRMRPSRRTWGKMPISSSRSIDVDGGSKGSPPSLRAAGGSESGLLLALRRGDGELLDDLVIAPLPGIVAHHLQDEILGLLAVALGVEGDLAGDAGELGLAHGGGDVLAGDLALLRRLLDGLEGDGGGVVGLG